MNNRMHVSLPAISKTSTTTQGLTIKMPVVLKRTGDAETRLTISDTARRMIKENSIGETAKTAAPEAIRDLLEGVDFRNITPRNMAVLAGKLYEKGAISLEAALNFTGIEMSAETPGDPDQPMDMIENFAFRLTNIKEAASKDSTLQYAVFVEEESWRALERLVSYSPGAAPE